MQGIKVTCDTSEWGKMVEVIFSKIERNLFPSCKINKKVSWNESVSQLTCFKGNKRCLPGSKNLQRMVQKDI